MVEMHQHRSIAFQHRNYKETSRNYTPKVYLFVEQEKCFVTRYAFTVNKQKDIKTGELR